MLVELRSKERDPNGERRRLVEPACLAESRLDDLGMEVEWLLRIGRIGAPTTAVRLPLVAALRPLDEVRRAALAQLVDMGHPPLARGERRGRGARGGRPEQLPARPARGGVLSRPFL